MDIEMDIELVDALLLEAEHPMADALLLLEAANEIVRLRRALAVYTEVVDNINRVAGHIPEVKREVDRNV